MIRRPPTSTLFPYPTPCRPRGDVPAGARREGAAAEAADRGVELGDAGLHRGEGVGLAGAAGVVEVHAHRDARAGARSEEHTSELQSRQYLVCRLLLEKKKTG